MTTSNILNDTLQADYKAISATFLNEWTADQFKAMKRAILKHFTKKPIIRTLHGNARPKSATFAAIDDIIGLAYTSSSSYAGYWVCNTEVYNFMLPEFKYVGFALTTDNKAYAILWDKDENEIIQPL